MSDNDDGRLTVEVINEPDDVWSKIKHLKGQLDAAEDYMANYLGEDETYQLLHTDAEERLAEAGVYLDELQQTMVKLLGMESLDKPDPTVLDPDDKTYGRDRLGFQPDAEIRDCDKETD